MSDSYVRGFYNMKCFVTDKDNNFVEKNVELLEGNGNCVKHIRVYSDVEFQSIFGMGGAFTEASSYVWLSMPKNIQDKLIDLYFSESGANYNFCRLHIQSCDFSLGNYSYISNEKDFTLDSFDMSRDKEYILKLVNAALEKNKDIEFLASPWSPPAFMKDNGQMNNGGKLLLEFYEMWAKVMARYVLEMRNNGVNITRVTVQNEPEATQTWDSCRYSSKEESVFATEYLRNALDSVCLDFVKINIWDHNKEIVLDRAREVLFCDDARKKIDGIGFHWYTGDHFEELEQVHREFPEKELIFTEGCVEFSRFSKDDDIAHGEMYAHDIIGNFNAGANAFIDWNLFLNYEGGPNHVGNFCSAPIMVNPDNGEYKINKSFYYISHFSRFIQKGCKRILVSRFSSAVETVGFKNPDGSIFLVCLNRNGFDVDFDLFFNGHVAPINMKAHSICSFVI